jgi:hypothetical protein
MLLAKAKSGEINMSKFSSFVGDGNPAVIERGDSKSHIIDRPITADGVCPFRVSTTNLEAIDDVLTTYSEILQLCWGKVVTLEAARNSICENFFALELNMDDRRAGILETEESISCFEEELAHPEDEIREFLDEVSFFFCQLYFQWKCVSALHDLDLLSQSRDIVLYRSRGVDFSYAYWQQQCPDGGDCTR